MQWAYLILHVVALHAAILPPPWADPDRNPCSTQPGGWLKLYWPPDGKCYRIFQRGAPCPDTMELSPPSPGSLGAECRCPPGQVQVATEGPCYPIHTQGPCKDGQYVAPTQQDARGRWGACKQVAECSDVEELFWPRDGECYPRYTRGPCPLGNLLTPHNRTGLAECGCESTGPLSRYYWAPSKSCHQFYTRGPCLESGTLFLPGPQCGCHRDLPHYHPPTEQCYQIGTSGPCKSGQVFAGVPTGCECKPGHVPWRDGQCYREFTKGPCPPEQLLTPGPEGGAGGECRALPCPRGQLYFPREDTCHRAGVRGPCARNQLVLFEQSVRPAVEGISYRGMCGCPGSGVCHEEPAEGSARNKVEPSAPNQLCETVQGRLACHQLYTQGPCSPGQWLVPARQARAKRAHKATRIPTSIGVYIGHRFNPALVEPVSLPSEPTPQLFQENSGERRRGRCECRPGYAPMPQAQGCQQPLVALAKFLNGQDYFT